MHGGDSIITIDSIKGLHDWSRTLIHGDDFIYVLPHPNLRNWISNYTITFPVKEMMSNKYSIVPHGSATLVFINDDNLFCNLFGPITKPVCIGSQANNYKMLFIVEFQPSGYYAFSEIPQKELTDYVLPFEVVNPVMNRLIANKLEDASDIKSLIIEMDRLFFAYLKTAFYQQEFSLANQMIIDNGGLLSVKELSKNVFYSERHLNRIFDKYLGIGVKSYSRLVRVNKAIRFLKRSNYSLTQIYMETGFHDMPHFIHDFKSICGITPQEYRDNMSDFYNEIVKF